MQYSIRSVLGMFNLLFVSHSQGGTTIICINGINKIKENFIAGAIFSATPVIRGLKISQYEHTQISSDRDVFKKKTIFLFVLLITS